MQPAARSRHLLTLSPTFTDATNDAEEAMTARANRGRRNLIMILKQMVLSNCWQLLSLVDIKCLYRTLRLPPFFASSSVEWVMVSNWDSIYQATIGQPAMHRQQTAKFKVSTMGFPPPYGTLDMLIQNHWQLIFFEEQLLFWIFQSNHKYVSLSLPK